MWGKDLGKPWRRHRSITATHKDTISEKPYIFMLLSQTFYSALTQPSLLPPVPNVHPFPISSPYVPYTLMCLRCQVVGFIPGFACHADGQGQLGFLAPNQGQHLAWETTLHSIRGGPFHRGDLVVIQSTAASLSHGLTQTAHSEEGGEAEAEAGGADACTLHTDQIQYSISWPSYKDIICDSGLI